jgi:hypothetical protein
VFQLKSKLVAVSKSCVHFGVDTVCNPNLYALMCQQVSSYKVWILLILAEYFGAWIVLESCLNQLHAIICPLQCVCSRTLEVCPSNGRGQGGTDVFPPSILAELVGLGNEVDSAVSELSINLRKYFISSNHCFQRTMLCRKAAEGPTSNHVNRSTSQPQRQPSTPRSSRSTAVSITSKPREAANGRQAADMVRGSDTDESYEEVCPRQPPTPASCSVNEPIAPTTPASRTPRSARRDPATTAGSTTDSPHQLGARVAFSNLQSSSRDNTPSRRQQSEETFRSPSSQPLPQRLFVNGSASQKEDDGVSEECSQSMELR